MAGKRIRALDESLVMLDSDYAILDDNTSLQSKKITKENLLKEINDKADLKQDKDNNSTLATTSKSIVPAINEVRTSVVNTQTQVSEVIGKTTWEDAPSTNLLKLSTIMTDQKDPTGFVNWNDIVSSYNSTTRKITLTHPSGVIKIYRNGVLTTLTSPWVSEAHPDVFANYFLRFNGNGFEFDTTPWYFYCVQVAFVQYFDNYKFSLHETHGINMDYTTHEHLHVNQGTLKTAGGDFSDFTLASTTSTNRRPNISSTTLLDEDLYSTLSALTTKSYTIRRLAGSANTKEFVTDYPEIVPVSGNQPFYNEFNGTNWVQTLMGVNDYQVIFVVAVPMSSDANSQKYRYMFVQGQAVYSTLNATQSVIPSSIQFGDLSIIATEYNFIGKIIIRYTSNNWSLISVEKLSGSMQQQISIPQGCALTIVSTDNTLTGDGTPTNLLGVNELVVYDSANHDYDNTNSTLVSDKVQDAIDEVDSKFMNLVYTTTLTEDVEFLSVFDLNLTEFEIVVSGSIGFEPSESSDTFIILNADEEFTTSRSVVYGNQSATIIVPSANQINFISISGRRVGNNIGGFLYAQYGFGVGVPTLGSFASPWRTTSGINENLTSVTIVPEVNLRAGCIISIYGR